MGQVIHALLTRPPLRITTSARGFQKQFSVRLACVKHAASVHPEPGSNSQKMCLFQVQHKLTSLHIPFYCFKGSFDRSLNVSVFPDCLIKEFSRIVFMCFTVQLSRFSFAPRLSKQLDYYITSFLRCQHLFFTFFNFSIVFSKIRTEKEGFEPSRRY